MFCGLKCNDVHVSIYIFFVSLSLFGFVCIYIYLSGEETNVDGTVSVRNKTADLPGLLAL